jgi:uncharacterized protein (TIRG00374 family)
MKKKHLIIGSFISLVFIVLVFWKVDLSLVWENLKQINYLLIIPAVIIQLSSYWVRAWRWSFMLKNIKKTRIKNLFPVICISYMANNVLPLRIGEVVRAYLVGKKETISKSAAFSSIILERILDGLTLLLFLGLAALLFPFPSWVKQIGFATAIVFAGALVFVVSLVLLKKQTLSIIMYVSRIFPSKIQEKANDILENFVDGLTILKDKSSFFPIIVLSLIIWCMEGTLFYAIAEAFSFDSTIYIAMFVMVIVNLGIMIPSSPGYVGTLEYFCVKALGVFNITKEFALSYALILRVFQYIPITVLGYYFLVKEGISLTNATSSEEGNKIRRGNNE